MPKKHIDRFHKNYIEKDLRKLIDKGMKLINDNDALSGLGADMPLQFYINSIMESLKDDLKSLCDKQMQTAYKVGYARAARSHGVKTVILTPDQDGWFCETCEEIGSKNISLIDKNGSYASMLSTHDNCSFEITIGEK